MENASKALLIAGGVLIAIMVASLGVYFARTISAQSAKTYAQLEESKIAEFNQKFLKFNNEIRFEEINSSIKTYKTGSINIQDIATLIYLAKDSNRDNNLTDDMSPANPENDKSMYVTVQLNDAPVTNQNAEKLKHKDLTDMLNSQAGQNKLYSCEIEINSFTGYVNLIKIGY